MKKISQALSFVLLVAASATGTATFCQTSPTPVDQYSAPVVWSEFNVPSQKVSFTFPKLPVVRWSSDPCSQIESGLYHAYAGEAVYEFEWHAKSHEAVPNWCGTKTKFSKSAFADRIKELKSQSWGYVESKESVAGMEAVVLRSTGFAMRTRWLIWNKDQWLELGITRRKDTVVDEARFVAGLKLASSTGSDVGYGATSTLGDPSPDASSRTEGTTSEGLVIVTKPRPGYTEAARHANIQGTVMLRVTFLSNGGIGSVSVVKGLTHGLTEQAIAASKKMAFLPSIYNGKPVTVTKQVEYTFSIY